MAYELSEEELRIAHPEWFLPRRGSSLGTPNATLESTQKGMAVQKDNTRDVLQDGKKKKDKPKAPKAPGVTAPPLKVTDPATTVADKPLPAYKVPDEYKGNPTPVNGGMAQTPAEYLESTKTAVFPTDEELQEEEHRSLLQAIMGWDDIPAGQKWHHYLQHGLLAPGALSSDEARKNAALEGKPGGMSSTFGQELRYRASENRRQQTGWENLLRSWKNGEYVGREQDFFRDAEQLRNAYVADGFDPSQLRNPPPVASGHAQTQYKQLIDNYEKMQHMHNWMAQIQEAVANDPNWLKQGPGSPATILFDKLAEYTIIGWAQSKGAIADAEKIRAQVAALPQAQKNLYYNIVQNYLGSNAQNAAVTLANQHDYSALATLKKIDELLTPGSGKAWKTDANGKPVAFDDETLAELYKLTQQIDSNPHMANAIWQGINAWRAPTVMNTPIDANAAITANENTIQNFQQWMMQNADVDRAAIWREANMLVNNYEEAYNQATRRLGKYWGWDYTGKRADPKFADYLQQVQEQTVPPDAIYSTTSFGFGAIPTPVTDPLAKEGGNKSGQIRRTTGGGTVDTTKTDRGNKWRR